MEENSFKCDRMYYVLNTDIPPLGKDIKSESFSWYGCKFRFVFCNCGNFGTGASIGMLHESEPDASFTISSFVKRNDGKLDLFVPAKRNFTTVSALHNGPWTEVWSMEEYNSLLRNLQNYLVNGKLTLLFVFDEYFTAFSDIQYRFETRSEETEDTCRVTFQIEMEDLLETTLHSDVVLKCGEKRFDAHRAILAARSPVFHKMFSCNTCGNQTGFVEISGVEPNNFERFLKFLYTGCTEECRHLSKDPRDVPFEFYAISQKYEVESLRDHCAACILDDLSAETVARAFLLAEKHEDKEFMKSLTEYVAKAEWILSSKEWTSFASEHPSLAVKAYMKFHET